MHVITYILQGSMEAKLFNRLRVGEGLFVRETKMLRKGDIAITEAKKDNFHEFFGKEEKCSFLDIIFPDYNETDRVCTYYNTE